MCLTYLSASSQRERIYISIPGSPSLGCFFFLSRTDFFLRLKGGTLHFRLKRIMFPKDLHMQTSRGWTSASQSYQWPPLPGWDNRCRLQHHGRNQKLEWPHCSNLWHYCTNMPSYCDITAASGQQSPSLKEPHSRLHIQCRSGLQAVTSLQKKDVRMW